MTVAERALFNHPALVERVVNVASVKQLSPFRYPGGKTWFVPYLKKWLSGLRKRPQEFIEPFAGGASIGLTVLYENLADQVTLVELDVQVTSVWEAIFQGDANALGERIVAFDLSLENVLETLAASPVTLEDRAFQTIVRNRVNRGGILASGAGMIKAGENGKGLHSRWYPETLKTRILRLASLRDRVTIIHGDGIAELETRAEDAGVVAFIDPPYTVGGKKAGNRLYNHFELNHEHLFRVAERLRGDFVMTYDNAPEVEQFARNHTLETLPIAMKNTHHEVMTELVVGRSLEWIR